MAPLVIIFIAVILIVGGVRGQADEIGAIVKDDFTGKPNFVAWLVVIGFIGILASIKETKQIATPLMALAVISVLLANRGFFDELKKALQ